MQGQLELAEPQQKWLQLIIFLYCNYTLILQCCYNTFNCCNINYYMRISISLYKMNKTGLTQTIINKSEKEVTVNENGIADAVEKLYDSVVVVQNYQKNILASSGTGFVYQIDGDKAYILTNHHVISGANNIKVMFTNNETYEVEIVGSD